MEEDLKRYFGQKIAIDKNSNRSLTINILKADTYWVWTSAQKLPYIGIAFAAGGTDIGMNLKVLIELEENGKVVSNYLFDEKIVIKDDALTEEALKKSYARLIATYRQKFFREIEGTYLRRYF